MRPAAVSALQHLHLTGRLSRLHREYRQLFPAVPQGQQDLLFLPVSLPQQGPVDPALLLPRLADIAGEKFSVHDKGRLGHRLFKGLAQVRRGGGPVRLLGQE